MLYVSRFVPNPDTFAEFIATLWQGPVPERTVCCMWLYMQGEPRSMLLIWEATSPEGEAWVQKAMGSWGQFDTEAADDATPGMVAAFERDVAGFGAWQLSRGGTQADADRAMALRQGGKDAATWDAAVEAGRAWAADG